MIRPVVTFGMNYSQFGKSELDFSPFSVNVHTRLFTVNYISVVKRVFLC